jgi:hypothetical protein
VATYRLPSDANEAIAATSVSGSARLREVGLKAHGKRASVIFGTDVAGERDGRNVPALHLSRSDVADERIAVFVGRPDIADQERVEEHRRDVRGPRLTPCQTAIGAGAMTSPWTIRITIALADAGYPHRVRIVFG